MPYSSGVVGTVTPGTLAGLGAIVDKGYISLPADFPTPAAVLNDWFYKVLADVTDNDPTRTNTGQVFFAGDEILWKAASSTWEIIGRALLPAGSTYVADVTPVGAKNGINDLFTMPGVDAYVATTIEVFLNGVSYNPESITRIDAGGGVYHQFRIVGDTLPNDALGDSLTCSYVKPA